MNLRTSQSSWANCKLGLVLLVGLGMALSGCSDHDQDDHPVMVGNLWQWGDSETATPGVIEGDQGRVDSAPLLDPEMPFHLDWRTGCFMRQGSGFLSISHAGQAVVGYYAPWGLPPDESFRRLEFALGPGQVQQLRTKLAETGFADLGSYYEEPRIMDGMQLAVTVQVGENRKTVYCINRFPSAIRELGVYLEDQFIQPRWDQLEQEGTRVPTEETLPNPWPKLQRMD